jgi:hypothetical protein
LYFTETIASAILIHLVLPYDKSGQVSSRKTELLTNFDLDLAENPTLQE